MAVELLKVEDLCHDFGRHRVVEHVSFSLEEGEILGLVGESGSGKTTLGRCIMGLYRPTGGSITFRGHPLSGGARKKTIADRAAGSASPIQMIFQDPMASLDPRMTVGESVAEGDPWLSGSGGKPPQGGANAANGGVASGLCRSLSP